jgi:hypothetical protein
MSHEYNTKKVFCLLANVASQKSYNSEMFRTFSKALLLHRTYVDAVRNQNSADLWIQKIYRARIDRVDALFSKMTGDGYSYLEDDHNTWKEIHAIIRCTPAPFFQRILWRYMDFLADTPASRGFVYHLLGRGYRENALMITLQTGSAALFRTALDACSGDYDFLRDPDQVLDTLGSFNSREMRRMIKDFRKCAAVCMS